MITLETISLVITATLTALIAGLFYAYSCSVVPGLGGLPDAQYLAAMQSINRAILNPVFFASFMGTLLCLPFCTYLCYKQGVSPRVVYLLCASLLYASGVFGVTMVGNVPLNEALDTFSIHAASANEIAQQRIVFEASWNRLNLVRTGASLLTLVLVVLACLARSKGE
jgi:uncharacterized membrane protein